MSNWALPAAFAGAMVAFTAMRKVGLARYLKGHQRSIAAGVALTVALPSLANLGVLDAGFEAGTSFKHAAFVLVPQAATFIASLVLRKENEGVVGGWTFVWLVAMVAAQTLMCGYLSLAAGLVGVSVGVMLKGRMGYLVIAWSALCLAVTAACLSGDETGASAAWAFVLVELATLLIVKIAHPLLDGDAAEVSGAGGDLEHGAGWQW